MSVLRTLVVTEGLPYPTYKGGDLRVWQNINRLMSASEVGVFGLCSNDPHRDKIPEGVVFWRSSNDPALIYPPARDRRLGSRAWPLDPMGHPSDWYFSNSAAEELENILTEFRPQVVVMESLWLHRYIDVIRRKNCRIVLDCHNVETALFQARASINRGKDLQSRLICDVLPARTAMIEHRAARAVDQIWVCSSADASLMTQLHKPRARIHVVPNGLDIGRYDESYMSTCPWPATVDPSKRPVAFVGMFGYWPNAAAALFLINEFLPRLISRSRECQLLLVGGMPTRQMLQASSSDARIVVTGTVSDIRPYLAAASVLVVPLFEGGGTRFKILEAFAAKVPVVSTAKGAEGLRVEDGTHLLIAESADEFVDGVLRVWADEPLKNRLTVHGRDLVRELYSWPVAGRQIRQALQELTSGGAIEAARQG